MNIYEAMSKMKAPGAKRDTWGNGIIQIHITRACDLACIGCTQGSNLVGKPVLMTPIQFEIAVESLVDYHGVVGIFGGNPCVHPKFDQIARILAQYIPKERRGLWSNNLNGHGKLCREIFNPDVSNLNVHMNMQAYMDILRDWPEAHPKGLADSRHSPPFVAMRDLGIVEDEIWDLVSNCDINQNWSAMICVVNGVVKGYFCEIAGAQAMLHQDDPLWNDLGIDINKNWWRHPMEYYEHQVRYHCVRCGIPLRGHGDLAITGNIEQVSETHLNIYGLKRTNSKVVQLVRKREELGAEVKRATDYIENGLV